MAGPTTTFQTGVHGSRPAASAGCVLYSCTTHSLIYRSDGSAWTTFLTIPTGSGVATDPIWDAAGDLAVGSGADTAAKLTLGAAGGHVSRLNGAVAWNSGTSNPTATTGDRYWRTDLGMEVYYDGTRWLTTQIFRDNLIGAAGLAENASASTSLARIPTWSGLSYDIYALHAHVMMMTPAGGTLNGSHFWTFEVLKYNATGTNSVIATRGNSADTAGNWTTTAIAINAVVTAASGVMLYAQATKTGSPNGLYCSASITYRLVIT